MNIKPVFHKYRLNIRWTTISGAFLFGILVPTIFIPSELGSREHLISILVAVITSFITWEGTKAIQYIAREKYPWEKGIFKHIMFHIFSIFSFCSFMLLVALGIYDQLVSAIDLSIGVVSRIIIVTFLLVLVFTAYVDGAYLFEKWKTSLVEQERLKKEAVLAKLESLKKQLDPHFLFNNLSVLSGIIHTDTELADTFITKLAKVYRYVLEHNEEKLVSVKEEIEFLKTYVFLLNVRFNKKVLLDVSPHLEQDYSRAVLPLSLQLLLENVVKHNQLLEPIKVKIFTEQGTIWVENKKKPRPQEALSTGIGLRNLSSRYEIIANETIQIENNKEIFKVGLPLLNTDS